MKKATGHCCYCHQSINARSSVKHFHTCPERHIFFGRQPKQAGAPWFLVRVESNPYWVDILLPHAFLLSDLDDFLRQLWLECCGHLSHFIIGGTIYEKYRDTGALMDDSLHARDMLIRLGTILKPGIVFKHEYDYGSTTELSLKVIESLSYPMAGAIFLCARNDMHVWQCVMCKAIATHICPYCGQKCCTSCSMVHPCAMGDSDALLPLVNSPRTGVCGYCGDTEGQL